MKITYKYFVFVLGITAMFQACKKYDGDSYDFSNKLNAYIRVTPGQSIVINSNTADSIIGTDTFYYYLPDSKSLSLETKEGFDESIMFSYDVKTHPGVVKPLSGILPQYKTTKKLSIAYDGDRLIIDGNSISISDTTVNGVFTLKSATGTTKGNLTIGYPLEGNNINTSFTANKPNILHHY